MNNSPSKDNHKISIGLPVFNGESFIRQALDSLLAQTYRNFELIISDNASTDQTEAICREYMKNDSRIFYARMPINHGAFVNFESVLIRSTGEYFMWAAADDVWSSTWLETLIEPCVKYQCIVFGRVRQIDSEGKIILLGTNERDLSFTGSRFKRRSLFFLEPGLLGKANTILGMYPKRILTPYNFSILAHNYIHRDMIFLYNLLDDVEIRAGYNTFIYKRIHNLNNGSMHKLEFTICSLLSIDFYFKLINKLIVGLEHHNGYYQMSNFYERIVIVLLLPPAIIYDLLIRALYKIKYR